MGGKKPKNKIVLMKVYYISLYLPNTDCQNILLQQLSKK